MIKHTCRKCKEPLTEQNSLLSDIKNNHYICRECKRIQNLAIRKKNPEVYKACNDRAHIREGRVPMDKNKDCSMYLGVHIAERVLSKVFKNVKRMSTTNQGYDFICNKGMKIDVKSSCILHRKNQLDHFTFNIKRNTIADYFLCLAFNNRNDLNPIHMWLLPGDKFNHIKCTTISETSINKWDEYRLPIDNVVSCCEVMRS